LIGTHHNCCSQCFLVLFDFYASQVSRKSIRPKLNYLGGSFWTRVLQARLAWKLFHWNGHFSTLLRSFVYTHKNQSYCTAQLKFKICFLINCKLILCPRELDHFSPPSCTRTTTNRNNTFKSFCKEKE
jgi:hypothetical protein